MSPEKSPRLQIKRPRPAPGTSVAQLSALELRQELERRIRHLQGERDALLEKVSSIERDLEALGAPLDGLPRNGAAHDVAGSRAAGSGRGRRRTQNAQPLGDVLAAVLGDRKPRRTAELAAAATAAGYLTTSRNFTNSVGVALHRDKRFAKQDGMWVLADQDQED